MKDAEEFAGAHILSMVRAHYPLVDLSRLEKGYPKEVGPQEAYELRGGLLDLSSMVIGDINLCGTCNTLGVKHALSLTKVMHNHFHQA